MNLLRNEVHERILPQVGQIFQESHPTDGALNKINEFYEACQNMDFSESGLTQAIALYTTYLKWDPSESDENELKRQKSLALANMNLLTDFDGFLGVSPFPSIDNANHELILMRNF